MIQYLSKKFSFGNWKLEIGNFIGGFTLLEILISISIIALLGATSIVSFINSRNIRDLTSSSQNVLSVLRFAQSKALAGEDGAEWGVHIEQTRVVLFRGANFAVSTSTQVHLLPSNIEIVNINLAGSGQDVVFKRINGRTDHAGLFDIRVKSSPTNVFAITVDSSGKVYQAGTSPAPTGTRVVDARHRSFNLGWSIENSLSLILTFSDPPNPNVVHSVVMAPVSPRTSFDWSGTVSVGGQNQILRIHATSITPTNTILQIDRDCRYNNKRAVIAIDTRDIAAYGANCQTVDVGAFGGTMSEP